MLSKIQTVLLGKPSMIVKQSKIVYITFMLKFNYFVCSYFVIPLWAIVIYNTLWQSICVCFRSCPTVLALTLCKFIAKLEHDNIKHPLELLQLSMLAYSPLFVCLVMIALGIDIMSKWLLLGRREAGVYPWDQSSYCQVVYI